MKKDDMGKVRELPAPEVDYEEEMEKAYFLSLQGQNGYKRKWVNGYAFWKGQYTARNLEYNKMKKEKFKSRDELFKSCRDESVYQKLYHKVYEIDEDIDFDLYSFFTDEEISYELLKRYISIINRINIKFPYWDNKVYQMDVLYDISKGLFPPNAGYAGFFVGQFPTCRSKTLSHKGVDEFGRNLFAIDLTAEMSSIIAEFRNAVEKIKNANKPDAPDEHFVTFCGADPDLTRRVRFSELQCATSFEDRDIVALYDELQAKGAAYKPTGDESRAIGLLMYDCIHTEGIESSDAGAYRWVKQELAEHGPKNLGKSYSSERKYQDWLFNTRKCIDAAEVLKIS